MKKLILFLSLLSIFVLLPTAYSAETVSAETGPFFSDTLDMGIGIYKAWRPHDSNIKAAAAEEAVDKNDENKTACIKVEYNGAGTSGYWMGVDISAKKLSEVYVRFSFKRKHWDKGDGGCKFLKIFGQQGGEGDKGYANTTFMLNYYSGNLFDISYGAGYAYENDGQDVIRYGGLRTDGSVVVNTSKGTYYVSDNIWVSFQAYIKYNTNGKRDGEYKVWIDDTLWLDATNIVNRNDANSQYIKSIDFANYAHSMISPWNLYYDSVVISENYIPAAPKMNH